MDDRTTASAETALAATADLAAFERLTMPYLTDVARFARSLTRDRTRADDLVQETYLRALRGWQTFHEGADPRRWLFSVCHHTFLRTIQREARYVEAPEDDPELESLATALAHSSAQRSGLAEAVERMDLGPAIDRALDEIPAHFRDAVVLVDVEGQSYEETAMILGIPVGTVRSRLFRGRRLLQDLLFVYARDAGFASAEPSTRTLSQPSRTSRRGSPPQSPTDAR
jgi:RNA polymerase sigma-70 factor (ECF subfamily)